MLIEKPRRHGKGMLMSLMVACFSAILSACGGANGPAGVALAPPATNNLPPAAYYGTEPPPATDNGAPPPTPVSPPTAQPGFDPDKITCTYPVDNTLYWDVAAKWGAGTVSQGAIASGIAAANLYWTTTDPDKNIVLSIPAGIWNIGGNGKTGIDLTGLNSSRPGAKGRLIIAGQSMKDTTLVFTEMTQRQISGSNVNRFHLCNLHMTRSENTVSQGTVVGYLKGAQWSATDPNKTTYGYESLVNPGTLDTSGAPSDAIVLKIHDGFPSPDDIYDPTSGQGRYLRKFSYNKGQPYLIQDDNAQIPWTKKAKLADGDWVLGLDTSNRSYGIGDLVGIKSKKSGEAIWMATGGDVTIENVKLTLSSRMLFRGGLDKIKISNLSIERSATVNGLIPFMSTSEGGPQLGHAADPQISNVIVENARIIAPGDDGIGTFNTIGASITNVMVEDGFARGILLDKSADKACIRNTFLNRNPLLVLNPQFTFGCQADVVAPDIPSHLQYTAADGKISLNWTMTAPEDFDGYSIFRSANGGPEVNIANGVKTTGYVDIALAPGTSYVYSVQAFDRSRNASGRSTPVDVMAK